MIRRQKEIEEFLQGTEFSGAELYPLAGDASARRYVRVKLGGREAMVMDTPAEGENFPAFVQVAEFLYKNGCSAPEILARDMKAGFLLLEDFGDASFTSILKGGNGEVEKELYSCAIDLLVQKYNCSAGTLPSLPNYDEELYLKELSLFPDWYLPQVMEKGRALEFRNEYMEIWREILRVAPLNKNVFVHRDLHADNLMWLTQREGTRRLGLLDFQDAVIGDSAYDMVSLLEDARRDVPQQLVSGLIAEYLEKSGEDSERFHAAYNILGAQRNSKIIGIFVRLAVRDGKANYLKLLPRVWGHLQRDIKHPALGKLELWIEKKLPYQIRGELKL